MDRLFAMFVALLFAVALTLAPAASSPAGAASCIQINRIHYNPPGTDTRTNAQLNAEWVRLRNGCSTGKSLTGWRIRDVAGHTYTFGTYTLRGASTVTVHTGRGTNTRADRYWGRAWYVWNNTGDTASLRTAAGKLVDRCVYTATSRGYTDC